MPRIYLPLWAWLAAAIGCLHLQRRCSRGVPYSNLVSNHMSPLTLHARHLPSHSPHTIPANNTPRRIHGYGTIVAAVNATATRVHLLLAQNMVYANALNRSSARVLSADRSPL